MDLKIIEAYESGGEKLARDISGLTLADLHWMPGKDAGVGLWSIQQIVIHLMDADLIWSLRMKQMIAEDHPSIMGYDESKFAANLFYDKQDAAVAVKIFDLNRRLFAKTLRKLPDSAFSRTGLHNEAGNITLGGSVMLMVEHLDHHLKFIEAKRGKMNKRI